MPSVGSVSLSLELDKSRFIRDVQAVRGLKLDPISVQVAADTSRFQQDVEQLKREKFKCIQVPVCLSTTNFARQLNEWQRQVKDKVEINAQLNTRDVERQLQGLQSGLHRPITLVAQVDTTQARQEIAALQTQLNQLTSVSVSANIEQTIRHVIDPAPLKGTFSNAIAEFRHTGRESNQKLVDDLKQVRLKTAGGGLLGLATAPFRMAATGLFEGLGLGFGSRLSQGMAQGFEKRLGKKLTDVGKEVEQHYGDLGTRVSDKFLQTLGFSKGLDGLKREVGETAHFVESAFEDVADNIAQSLRSALLGEFQSIPKHLQALLQNTAGAGLKMATTPVRIRNQVMADQAAQQATELARQIVVPKNEAVEQAKSITLVTGGFTGEKGGLENSMFGMNMAEPVLRESYIETVPNAFLNQFETGTKEALLELFKALGIKLPPQIEGQADKLAKMLEMAVLQGFDPDAVMLAARAAAFKKAYPDKDVNLVAHSGGGWPVANAIDYLNRMGVEAKGVGLMSPFTGVARNLPENFTPIMGTADHLYDYFYEVMGGLFRPPQQMQVFEGKGDKHSPINYLRDKEIRAAYYQSLGMEVPEYGKEDLNKPLSKYTTVRAQEDKNIEGAIRTAFDQDALFNYFLNKDNPLQGLEAISAIQEKLKKSLTATKGSPQLNAQVKRYIDLLDTLFKELEVFYATAGEIKPLASLQKAAEFFPGLKDLEKQFVSDNAITRNQELVNRPEFATQMDAYKLQAQVAKDRNNLIRTFQQMYGQDVEGYSFAQEPAGLQGLTDWMKQLATPLAGVDKNADKVVRFLELLNRAIATFNTTGKRPDQLLNAAAQVLNTDIETLTQKSTKDVGWQPPELKQLVFNPQYAEEFLRYNQERVAAKQPPLDPYKTVVALREGRPEFSEVSENILPSVAPQIQAQAQQAAAQAELDLEQAHPNATEATRQVFNQVGTVLEHVKEKGQEALPVLQKIGGVLGGAAQAVSDAVEQGAVGRVNRVLEDITPDPKQAALLPSESALMPRRSESVESIAKIEKLGDLTPSQVGRIAREDMGKVIDAAQTTIVTVKKAGEATVKTAKAVKEFWQGVRTAKRSTEDLGDAVIDAWSTDIIADLIPGEALTGSAEELQEIVETVARLRHQFESLGETAPEIARLGQAVSGLLPSATGIDGPEFVREQMNAVLAELAESKKGLLQSGAGVQVSRLQGKKGGIDLIDPQDIDDLRVALLLIEGISGQIAKSQSQIREQQYNPEFAKEIAQIRGVQGDLGKIRSNALKAVGAFIEPMQEAAEAGDETAKGFLLALESALPRIEQTANRLAQTAIIGIKTKLGIASPSRVFQEIGRNVVQGLQLGMQNAQAIKEAAIRLADSAISGAQAGRGTTTKSPLPELQKDAKQTAKEVGEAAGQIAGMTAKAAAQGAEASLKQIKKAANDIAPAAQGGLGGFMTGFKQQFGNIGQQFPVLGRFKGLLQDVAFSALALFGAFSAGDIIVNTFQAAYQSAKRYQALQVGLVAASGSAAEGAKNFQFVREEAQRLSLPLEAAGKNFKSFQAAVRGTTLESQAKSIFSSVGEAATALQLNPEETDRAYMALTQIASKGTVSAEELRQQLSEAIPGAFQVAARAMGVTEAELNKLLETGSIMSSDFLPKFARQLHTELSGGLDAASKSAQATENRLANASLILQQSFNQMALPVIASGMQSLASAMQFASEQASTLGKVGLAVLIAGGLRLAPVLWNLAKTVFPVLSQGIMATGFAAGTAMKSMALFSGTVAAIAVAVEGWSLLATYLQDQGGAAREAADELKRLNDEYERLKAQQQGLQPPSEERQPLNWYDSMTNSVRKWGKENLPWLTQDAAPSYTPFADDAARNQVKANEDMIKQAIAARDRVRETLNATSLGQSPDVLPLNSLFELKTDKEAQALQDLANVRLQIQAKEQERGSIIGGRDMIQLTKDQKAAVGELDKQIQGLLDRQAELIKGPQAEADILTQAIEANKKRLAALDTPEGRGSLTSEQVQQEKDRLRQLIPDLEKNLKAINAVLVAEDPIAKLQKRFKDAKDAQAIGLSNLASVDARNKANIAEGFAKGKYSEKDYQLLELDQSKRSAEVELQAYQKTLKELKQIKESPAFSRLAPATQGQVNKGIIDAEKAVSEARSKAAQATVSLKKEQNQQILDDLERSNRKADAAIQASENERVGKIKRMQTAGIISEEEASAKIAQIQQSSTAKQIQREQINLAETKRLRKQGVLSEEEAVDRQIDINTKLSDLKLQQIDQELQARQALNQQILEGVERAYLAAETKISTARSARETQIKRMQLTGALTEPESGVLSAQAQQAQTEKEINLTRSKLRKNDELEARGLRSRNEAFRERMQLQQQLGQQTLQLANDELALQQSLINKDQARIDKAKELLGAREDLAKALLELEQVDLEAYSDQLGRGLNIYKDLQQIRDADQDSKLEDLPEKKREKRKKEIEKERRARDEEMRAAKRYLLQREFYSLGIDPNMRGVDILKQKIQLENQLAQNKRAALQKEQQLQMMLLILEQKKNKLAAERMLLDAKYGLAKARATGDPTQIALAQQGVKLAKERLTLEDALGKMAIATLGVKQMSEQGKFEIQERSRQTQLADEAAQVPGLKGQDLKDVAEAIFGQRTIAPEFESKAVAAWKQVGANLGVDVANAIPQAIAQSSLKDQLQQTGGNLGSLVGDAILKAIGGVKAPDLKNLGASAGQKINQELQKLLKAIFGNIGSNVPNVATGKPVKKQPKTQKELDEQAPRWAPYGGINPYATPGNPGLVITPAAMRTFWRQQMDMGGSIIYEGDTIERTSQKLQGTGYNFSAKEARQIAEQNWGNYTEDKYLDAIDEATRNALKQNPAFNKELERALEAGKNVSFGIDTIEIQGGPKLKYAIPSIEDVTKSLERGALLERERPLQMPNLNPALQPTPPPVPAPAPKSDDLSSAINRLEVAFAKSGAQTVNQTVNNYFAAEDRGDFSKNAEKQMLGILGKVVKQAAT